MYISSWKSKDWETNDENWFRSFWLDFLTGKKKEKEEKDR